MRNLGTYYIDLYPVHWPDPRTPAEETAEALDELVTTGKVRHVGVWNRTSTKTKPFVDQGALAH
jgi:aryl-alcohol dehydrogenase-like predicted oxidoreductase